MAPQAQCVVWGHGRDGLEKASLVHLDFYKVDLIHKYHMGTFQIINN